MTSGNISTPAAAAEPNILLLEGSADPSTAQRLLAAARQCAAADGDVVVDCAAVERLDGACIQVLLALRAKLASSGRALRMTGLPADSFSILLATGVAQALSVGNPLP